MPRDLFGDVTRPSISIGSRKWYTLPVSLISHSAIVLSIIAIPLLAPGVMPSVLANNDIEYIEAMLPPPPPPPRAIEPIEITDPPLPNPDAAPVVAPDTIAPEMQRVERDDPSAPGIIGGAADGEAAIIAPPPPRVEPPQPPAAVRVGFAGVRTPVKTQHVDPRYPAIAQAAGIQGIVIIEATISETGHVVGARVLRSVHLLDQAALDAVRQWQFTPTLLNGRPVPVVMTVTVHFTLTR
jgi:protein TonB